jgi:glutathione S-transferase
MIPGKYTVFGSDPSFFTCKVLAMFRYMGVPHNYIYKSQDRGEAIERRAGSHMVPIVETPEKWALWDSTPIGELLNARFPAAAIVPQTPVQKIAMKILDDFVDEWLPRQALFYRWAASDTLDRSAMEIACNSMWGRKLDNTLTEDELKQLEGLGQMIKENFGNRVCKVAGCGAEYADELNDRFAVLLRLLEEHRKTHACFFGERASMADLALCGASVAHFTRDQASIALVNEVSPGFAKWTDQLWYKKGGGKTFLGDDEIPATLLPILEDIANHFHVYLRGNHAALGKKEKALTFDYGYGPIERRAYRYSELSRQDVKGTLEALAPDDQARVREVLGPTGVLDIYDLEPLDVGFGSIATSLAN